MSQPQTENAHVISAVPGRTNVYVHLDVVYARRGGLDLHLQIIQPSGDAAMLGWEVAFAGRYPCIAFIQGSGWREQALGAAMSYLCRFAERGYVIAIVQYRPSAVAPHPAQVHDAKTAVRWLRQNSDQYGIDPDRITISGDSSGGHTALLVHATDGSAALDEDPEAAPLNLSSAVVFSSPTDLTLMDDDDAVRDLLGGRRPSQAPDDARAACPANHLDRRRRGPVLLVHGTDDEVVACEHSRIYAMALREAGHTCDLVLVEGARHGIWPSLFSPELADIMDEFLSG
ncbi:alpha/beta hydrolase [Intrasporangium calvum]|uniref:Esterase n=1 Tax=Intrasporangium calvum (strain ATCC 23552 / DSM 43043 / JCM 3097 / NBRC 12989 / NCIMB 10167 / NRRL B-3866 / 7 KIP) TaxID=710696 RepID=E6SG12_INTC7|nr:alpha/beta hydrolase [Intrasporangium calvum]ADU49966.1 putative esterase [Intrasporangium calvum DSM 43043]AXG14800.1 alpha/beta hydrolase [Intrasporangium calvum]